MVKVTGLMDSDQPAHSKAAATGGYAKSETTRAAIVGAALEAFGSHGFDATTTRQIAAVAGVALPSVTYHFGSKQGIYLACAQLIVTRHQQDLLPLLGDVEALLAMTSPAPEACLAMVRQLLKAVLRSFLAPPEGPASVDFAVRALREQGPGLSLLLEQIWAPGVALVARLIAAGRGAPPDLHDRAAALGLISSLLAMPLGRDLSLGLLGIAALDDMTLGVLDGVVDRLTAGVFPQARPA